MEFLLRYISDYIVDYHAIKRVNLIIFMNYEISADSQHYSIMVLFVVEFL